MIKMVYEILKWHADPLPTGPMRDSDLLFPSETGGYRAPSCLDRAFREFVAKIGMEEAHASRDAAHLSGSPARGPGWVEWGAGPEWVGKWGRGSGNKNGRRRLLGNLP
jgi:hypothetical protein